VKYGLIFSLEEKWISLQHRTQETKEKRDFYEPLLLYQYEIKLRKQNQRNIFH